MNDPSDDLRQFCAITGCTIFEREEGITRICFTYRTVSQLLYQLSYASIGRFQKRAGSMRTSDILGICKP